MQQKEKEHKISDGPNTAFMGIREQKNSQENISEGALWEVYMGEEDSLSPSSMCYQRYGWGLNPQCHLPLAMPLVGEAFLTSI